MDNSLDKIIILDFGSQTTQLIARRIRDFGVYSEIYPGQIAVADLNIDDSVKGIIFSGSPYSSYEKDAPSPDKALYDLGLPILGICFGFQRMTLDHGGDVRPLSKKEYGRSSIKIKEAVALLDGIPDGFVSWMSHGDSIHKEGEGFKVVAVSEHGLPAVAFNQDKNFYGIQFHPEVTHSEHGIDLLENFACKVCKAGKEWSMESYIEEEKLRLQEKVGTKDVLLLISGGVDSTVAGALLLNALPPKQIYLMYIDTGMMRKGESEEVAVNLKKLGAENLFLINARERFIKPLEGVSDPEKKRKIIGDTFIRVQEEEVAAHISGDYLLAQGTLYTDMIESGKGVGKNAAVIKSHHNVGTPLVEAKREKGLLVEPLAMLYKDEVRKMGSLLGIEKKIVHRHPFPGPGLGIRIISDVDEDKLTILRDADKIYIDELHRRGLYYDIWQAFSVLTPIRSVGVTGDARNYGYVLALRAVISSDGMTADVYPFPMKDLLEISSLITNSIPAIGRVVYDISSKPPATIEWE